MTSPSDESYADHARAAQRKYRESNKDAKNLKSREYYAANKQRILSQKDVYRRENPEKIKAARRKYDAAHKEENKVRWYEYHKRYRLINRQALNEHARKYREENKAQLAERRKLWIANNTDRHAATQRRGALKTLYRLSLADWFALMEQQGGICPICETDDPGGRNWHTDHDHETGEIRGILCGRCNLMLGHARDNVGILRAAIEYLSVAGDKH